MPEWINVFSMREIWLLCLTGGVVAAFYGVRAFLRRRAEESSDNLFIRIFEALSPPVQSLFLYSTAFALMRGMPFGLENVYLFGKAYTIGMIALATWFILRVLNLMTDRFLRRFNIENKDNLNARRMHTQVKVIRRLAAAMIILIAVAGALMTFESIRSLGVSLLASAGVAGIVIGLAAQKTIGNFFTGLQIAITQPIRLGDAVVVEGEWGWIEEINLTYVVVRIWDLRRLVLPISYFVDHPFQNWTRTSADILGSVMLYVDYTMPLDPLRDELTRLLEGEARHLWDGKVQVVQVTDATEKTMAVRVLVSAPDSSLAWDLRCLLREKLIAFIRETYPAHLPTFRAELHDHANANANGICGDTA